MCSYRGASHGLCSVRMVYLLHTEQSIFGTQIVPAHKRTVFMLTPEFGFLLSLGTLYSVHCRYTHTHSHYTFNAKNNAYSDIVHQMICRLVLYWPFGLLIAKADPNITLLVSFPCKLNTFRKRVKNVVTSKGLQVGVECK